MTYEEAKKKALKVDNTLDKALEYTDAYVFMHSKGNKNAREYDDEVVVMKKDGKLKNFAEYIINTTNTSSPKKIQF